MSYVCVQIGGEIIELITASDKRRLESTFDRLAKALDHLLALEKISIK